MFKILILLPFLIFLAFPSIPALRLGADAQRNDLFISYNYDYVNYMLQFNSYNDAWELTLCFRYRPIIDNLDGTCRLGNMTGNFDCFCAEVNEPTTEDDDVFSKWIMSADYTTRINLTTYHSDDTTVDLTQNSYSIGLRGFDDNTGKKFSFIANPKGIYQLVSSDLKDLTDPAAVIRHNYLITFFQNYQVDSNDLIVQRQYHCYIHKNVYNVVFLGGVVRAGVPLYFIAMLNYHKTGQDFLLWQGLSYSRDKVLRDMVGFYPSQGYCDDLYSLYASAPYQDVADNINGTDDYTITATSDSAMTSNMASFYFMQVYRQYDTGDKKSDEVLTYKINNQFCYALYITYESDGGTDFFLYNDKQYKHEFLRCFEPVLALYGGYVAGMVMLVIMMLMLL